MDIIESLEWRYATKKFDATKVVPQEKINILIKSFNLTATSYGLQPLKLMVIQDKKQQLLLQGASYDQKQVADASHIFLICIESRINSDYITSYFKKVKEIRKTPNSILDPFKDQLIASFKTKSEEEIRGWAINQAYLAMGNLLATCAIEKIDSCPMEGFIPDQYNKLLGLNELNLHAVLVLPVGYRADDDLFATLKKVRRSVESTVIYR